MIVSTASVIGAHIIQKPIAKAGNASTHSLMFSFLIQSLLYLLGHPPALCRSEETIHGLVDFTPELVTQI